MVPVAVKPASTFFIIGWTSFLLSVTFNKKAFNPALFKTGYGFSATAHLSRKAFGLGNLEPIVGDDIDLIIDAEVY